MKNLSVLALVAATALSACGYTPMYATGGGADTAGAKVQVGSVEMGNPERNVGSRRVAQRVSQILRQDFPQAAAELDLLTVHIDETTSTLAVQRTSAVERAQINLTAELVLTSPEGKRLLRANLGANAPYNVENTPFSTESGKTYARLTAANNLADEITRRVLLYYRTQGK